jgi:hypothetical protein
LQRPSPLGCPFITAPPPPSRTRHSRCKFAVTPPAREASHILRRVAPASFSARISGCRRMGLLPQKPVARSLLLQAAPAQASHCLKVSPVIRSPLSVKGTSRWVAAIITSCSMPPVSVSVPSGGILVERSSVKIGAFHAPLLPSAPSNVTSISSVRSFGLGGRRLGPSRRPPHAQPQKSGLQLFCPFS